MPLIDPGPDGPGGPGWPGGLDVALGRPVEIAWVMAGAGRALATLLGVAEPPLVALSELQTAVLRVPWLGRIRNSENPAFAVGLVGIDEEACHIFLMEEREPVPGEFGAYRVPHLDEVGFRPGMHAIVRSAGSPVGHAVAAATAVAIAREAGGPVVDRAQEWLAADPATGSPAHTPDEVVRALAADRRYASSTDGAQALYARRPQAGPA